MINRIKLTMMASAIGLSVFSQLDTTKEIGAFNACEVNLLFGWYAQAQQYGTIDEFKQLAPGSTILKADFTGYNQAGTSWSNINGQFSANVGFRFSNKSKTAYRPNPILRLGFSYMNVTDLSNNLTNTREFRSDTLVSITNGSMYYMDSVITRNYNMRHNSDQIRLDVALVYRTNPKARWQFYGGMGLTAGISLNSNTSIEYAINNTVQDDSDQEEYYYPFFYYNTEDFTYQNEYYRNSLDFGMSVYTPLGLDFRMGKKREFWKRVHLFYEIRPGVAFSNIGDLRGFGNTCVQQGFGLKVNWE